MITLAQQRVIDGVLRGERYREIAEREGVTVKAIEVRARHVAEQMGVAMGKSTPGAIREALLLKRIAELEGR